MSLSFSFTDFLIVAIIAISAGYAAWRGFLWETLSIFEWVAAAFACLYLGPYFLPLTGSLVGQSWLAGLLAYAGVFLAVFIPMAFMSHRLAQGVKNSPIGPLDRTLGVVFGILRGMVVVGLAYLAFTYFVPIRQQPRWLTQARLLPAVQSTAEVLLTLVPNHGRAHTASVRSPATVRQAPPAEAMGPTPETGPEIGPKTGKNQAGDDPVADMIRRNGATVPAQSAPAQQQEVRQQDGQGSAKAYGAGERQALDSLVKATGGGK